jgi:hypothetical protein
MAEPVTTLTVLADDTSTVDAELSGDRVLVDPAELPRVLGWTLKPEGLCRAEVCVPLWDRQSVQPGGDAGDRVDLTGVAAALGRPSAVDLPSATMAIGAPAELRRQALAGRTAPAFELPDLDGRLHQLEAWQDRKRLLVAFASW